MFSRIYVITRNRHTNLIDRFFCFKKYRKIDCLQAFDTFSSLAPLTRFISCVIMSIMRFFINAWRFHLLFAFWIHAYLCLGFSPALLLFFLPVLLQNECCYFFACCILAFYILFTYPSHTIIYLLACILFCFFELNMQSLACLIFHNRFVHCFIAFFC